MFFGGLMNDKMRLKFTKMHLTKLVKILYNTWILCTN